MESTIAPHAQQNLSVVAFRLNQRTFALPLDVIMQILPMMTITPIPHLSKIVKGTINVRGEDVLVISLRTHFNMEEVELQLYTPLLLLKLNDRLLALVVDAVLDVMNLPLETLTNLQTMMPDGIESIPLLQGVSHYNDDSILVLDPDHLFYNNNGHIAQKTNINFNALIEEISAGNKPVPLSAAAPAAEKKPAAKKTPAARKSPAVTSAPVEDTPAAASAPVEDTPAVASAPVEDTPAVTSAPVFEDAPITANAPEDAPAPPASDPPTIENG